MTENKERLSLSEENAKKPLNELKFDDFYFLKSFPGFVEANEEHCTRYRDLKRKEIAALRDED